MANRATATPRGKLWDPSDFDEAFTKPNSELGADQVPTSVKIDYAKSQIEHQSNPGAFLANTLPTLNLDEASRFELALLYVNDKSRHDCDFLPCFDIRQPDLQMKVADACLAKCRNWAAVFPRVLDRVDAAKRRELAFKLAESDYKFLAHLFTLGLNEEDQFKLVLHAAKHQGVEALTHLPDAIRYSPEQAKQIAITCGPNILYPDVLRKLGITDETEVFRLGRYFAQHRTLEFSDRLPNFHKLGFTVEQQAGLMEACLEHGGPVAGFALINRECFTPDLRFRWLLGCARKDPAKAMLFQRDDFVLTPEQKIQFAKTCVAQAPTEIGELLHRFKIEDKTVLLSLALTCAKAGPEVLSGMSRLELEQEQTFQILLACTSHTGFALTLARSLKSYSLTEEQIGQLAQRTGLFNPDQALHFLQTALESELISRPNATAIARQCLRAGATPELARNAIGLNMDDQLSRYLEFHALWFHPEMSRKTWKNACRQLGDGLQGAKRAYRQSFKCQKLLVQIGKGLKPNFTKVSERLPAIAGKSEWGLQGLDNAQLALLDAMAQGNTFNTYFQGKKNEAGIVQWVPRDDTKFDNLIGKLAKAQPPVALTAGQCIHALKTLLFPVNTEDARKEWQAIGLHARSLKFFRSIAEQSALKKAGDPPVASDNGNPSAAEQQRRWITTVFILIETRKLSNEHVHLLIPLLDRLVNLKDMGTRRTLTQMAFEGSFQELAPLASCTANNVLPSFCIQPFVEQNDWLAQALAYDAKHGKRLKNFEMARPLVEAFIALRDFPLPMQTKNALLACIAPGNKNDLMAIATNVRKLVAILRLSTETALQMLNASSNSSSNSSANAGVNSLFAEALAQAFSLPNVDQNRYSSTFGSFRDPDTLLVFAGKMKSHPQALTGLGKVLKSVLDGEYPSVRYRNIDILERLDSILLQRWKSEKMQTLEGGSTLFAPATARPRPADQDIIRARITHYGHLDLTPFPCLARHLGVEGPRTAQSTEQSMSPFELAMIAWLQKPEKDHLDELSALLEQAQPGAELLHDLAMLREDANPSQSRKENPDWRMLFTDDYQQILRMGTDVPGSCQRIDGKPEKSRGLVGTLLDGRSKLCLIQDGSGQIVGRLVLRLMWNEVENKACLLTEPIYPDTLSTQLREKLTGFALRQARELGLDLITYAKPIKGWVSDFVTDPADAFTHTLSSGKFEYPPYADSVGGVADADFRLMPHADMTMTRVYAHRPARVAEGATV